MDDLNINEMSAKVIQEMTSQIDDHILRIITTKAEPNAIFSQVNYRNPTEQDKEYLKEIEIAYGPMDMNKGEQLITISQKDKVLDKILIKF